MTAFRPDSSAMCAQVDPDMWFPDRGGTTKHAKNLCRGCPLLDPCRDYALTCEENPAGIWGGTSERERRRLRKAAA